MHWLFHTLCLYLTEPHTRIMKQQLSKLLLICLCFKSVFISSCEDDSWHQTEPHELPNECERSQHGCSQSLRSWYPHLTRISCPPAAWLFLCFWQELSGGHYLIHQHQLRLSHNHGTQDVWDPRLKCQGPLFGFWGLKESFNEILPKFS